MLREVLGALMAGFMGVLILWLILPLLNTSYMSVVNGIKNNPNPAVSQNPTTLQVIALGDTVILSLGFLVFAVTGYIIVSYAARRDPYSV